MAKTVSLPKWLEELISRVIESDDWPGGQYPALAMEARDRIGEFSSDEDWQTCLLQLVIDEVERLREQT